MTEEVRVLLGLGLALVVMGLCVSVLLTWFFDRRARSKVAPLSEERAVLHFTDASSLVLVHAEVVDVGMITGILYEDGEEHGWHSYPLHFIRSIHWEKIDDEQ